MLMTLPSGVEFVLAILAMGLGYLLIAGPVCLILAWFFLGVAGKVTPSPSTTSKGNR